MVHFFHVSLQKRRDAKSREHGKKKHPKQLHDVVTVSAA